MSKHSEKTSTLVKFGPELLNVKNNKISKMKATYMTSKMRKCLNENSPNFWMGSGAKVCALCTFFSLPLQASLHCRALMVSSPGPWASFGGRLPEAFFLVFRLEAQGAKACKSCRSRQELSNEYLVFTCKIRLRYSRERASQSLPTIGQKISWPKVRIKIN